VKASGLEITVPIIHKDSLWGPGPIRSNSRKECQQTKTACVCVCSPHADDRTPKQMLRAVRQMSAMRASQAFQRQFEVLHISAVAWQCRT